jgi:eukaryotic-like serine/threonine-protein kinase
MSTPAGTSEKDPKPWRLGPYEIGQQLGAGGMGEVYRGHDTRLRRDVALKVLPPAFSQDPDRMARFAREAQVLAALNHPNIAAIYGLEESEGVRALVMELVEGPTLAERIAAGPIPLEEALPVAKEIAEALEYAHERGIVHRDLKPANIKLTLDGHVKVLDFGLAKAMSNDFAPADPASSPTLTMRATMAGIILGTAGYMAPEQARGMPADKRADIWAFGVVLIEMLTGRQIFSGETVSDTLAAVLRADLDWSALPRETPAAVRRLLRRCLERDRKRRMCDIGDARLEIDEALAAPAEPSPTAVAAPPQPRGSVNWWLAAVGVVALAGVVVAVVHFREPPPEAPAAVRFSVPAPDKMLFASPFRLALSPDGRRLVFTCATAQTTMLCVRSLDSLDARPLAGTEGAGAAFWSPDSRWIGFSADGKLKKIEAAGGPPQTLCNTPSPVQNGAWSRDGVILFGSLPSGGGLFRVSQSGGDVTRASVIDQSRHESAHGYPQFLPDNRHIIYFALASTLENRSTYLATLDGKERKRILISPWAAVYAPGSRKNENGHLLFMREGTLMAQAMDSRTFDFTGEAFPVADQIGSYLSTGFFTASEHGDLAYRVGISGSAIGQLLFFDRGGQSVGAMGPLGRYYDMSLSPDGKRVAVTRGDGQSTNTDIWLIDVARGVPQRFTFDLAADAHAVWSPDGTRLVFASARDGADNIYQKAAGGTANEEPLLKSPLPKQPTDWSRDGKFLLYSVEDPKTKSDLWILPMEPEGEHKPVVFLQTPFSETQGQFCPGPEKTPRWVAYSSDESGRFEIYVHPFPAGSSGSSGKFQISTGGGLQPRWRADGKELFYIAPDGKLMSVEVKTSSTFEAGVPKALFSTRIYGGGVASTRVVRYSVASEGRRFLIDSYVQVEENPGPVTVLLNWFAAVKK